MERDLTEKDFTEEDWKGIIKRDKERIKLELKKEKDEEGGKKVNMKENKIERRR